MVVLAFINPLVLKSLDVSLSTDGIIKLGNSLLNFTIWKKIATVHKQTNQQTSNQPTSQPTNLKDATVRN